MRFSKLHPWKVTPKQAREIQEQLRGQVVKHDKLSEVRFVAGIDVGFKKRPVTATAAVVVLRFPQLEVIESAVAARDVDFPYVPGLLSFREVPVVLDALARLALTPDLILCDGQGYAHPRRFGLACHLGVLIDVPTIGVAKTRLVGTYTEPGQVKGAWAPLEQHNEVIGAVLRTRHNTKPLYVSIGHRISLMTAIDYVLACCPKFRLPETTRAAHRLAAIGAAESR